MEKDLLSDTIKPEQLEAIINDYNKDVDVSIDRIIPDRVRDAFRVVTPELSTARGDKPLMPYSIAYENMIPFLQRYWFSRIYSDTRYHYDFNQRYQNPDYYLDATTIANVPPDVGKQLSDIILGLKNDSKITTVINGTLDKKGLRYRRNELIESANKLSENICNIIIYHIEKGDYHIND